MKFSISNTLFTPEELNVYYLPMKLKEQYYNKQKSFLENDKVKNATSVINVLTSKTEDENIFSKNLEFLDGVRYWDNVKGYYLKIDNWQNWWPEFLEWYEK